MNKALLAVGVLLIVVSGFAGYGGAVAAQHTRIQRLESENAQLKGKLDNIQDLVTEAKDDLDDVEDEVQSEESCEDTDAYSDAAVVEDKLNEIDSEASTEGPRDGRTPVPIALRWRAPFPFASRHRTSFPGSCNQLQIRGYRAAVSSPRKYFNSWQKEKPRNKPPVS